MKYLKNKISGEGNSYRIIYFLRLTILKNKKNAHEKIVLDIYFQIKFGRAHFFIYNDSNIFKSL